MSKKEDQAKQEKQLKRLHMWAHLLENAHATLYGIRAEGGPENALRIELALSDLNCAVSAICGYFNRGVKLPSAGKYLKEKTVWEETRRQELIQQYAGAEREHFEDRHSATEMGGRDTKHANEPIPDGEVGKRRMGF